MNETTPKGQGVPTQMIAMSLLQENKGQIEGLPANPRFVRDHKYQKLRKSIEDNPEMLYLRELLVYPHGKKYVIIGGNMRYRAMKDLAYSEAPCKVIPDGATPDMLRSYTIKDNNGFGEWDMDMLANEWDEVELEDWGLDLPGWEDGIPQPDEEPDKEHKIGSLSDRFICPPLSVLSTRTGEWVNRVREWKSIGLDSQKGRDDELTFSNTSQTPAFYDSKNKLRVQLGREPTTEEVFKYCEDNGVTLLNTTSIFDPALCETLYYWFNIHEGRILDPFAGGSVRGVVAGVMGMPYLGNDIRPEQVEANRKNLSEVSENAAIKSTPIWTIGDSTRIDEIVAQSGVEPQFDLLFSCPPYADLEVYSDDPNDISNMPYDKFLKAYREIISKSLAMLRDNRFAVFVVGEVRDKKGVYRNFVADTIDAFQDAGAKYYNEIILVNQVSAISIRVGRSFTAGRKVGKCHQNVLVFFKGDPKSIKGIYGEVMPRDYFDELLKDEEGE